MLRPRSRGGIGAVRVNYCSLLVTCRRDATWNCIWEACAWTQRVCSLDAYVDTPWREQAQWWGDARVQAKNTFFLSGDTRLFRRGIEQIAAKTTPEGLTYGHAPTIAHSCVLPDFTLIWLITLWDYYWQTGSLEPFLEQEQTIRAALKYFEDITDPKTGLIGYDKRYWLFLDWTGLFKEGYSTVYNLWLLMALERLAGMFRLANKPGEAGKLAAWAKRLRVAIGKLVRKDGLLCDGVTFAGKQVKETSIHSQTLAILADFQPAQNAKRIQEVLLPFIRQETKPEVYPSSYWITYVFEVLTSAGHGADVLRFIREKWAPMAEYGTTWENFAPRRGDESFSHAWSAHPLYHLMQILGGIRQNAPAWAEIVFEPVFEGDWNETVVPTPHGKIRSFWKRQGPQIEVELSLPNGVAAAVHLPGQKRTMSQGKANWILKT
ncbi:MAG: alpha-L-rhamnosidase C-terminal domain-containing protein [Verrucomicrobiae bacterium]